MGFLRRWHWHSGLNIECDDKNKQSKIPQRTKLHRREERKEESLIEVHTRSAGESILVAGREARQRGLFLKMVPKALA